MFSNIDINKQKYLEVYPKVLNILLKDRTTGHNIIWATDDYSLLGESYRAHYQITSKHISGLRFNTIQPRIGKTKENQGLRTKAKAEVFTPAWLCNKQNNLIDSAWFGRENVFNRNNLKSWESIDEKIEFPESIDKNWHDYIKEPRLEIACGEAPYLVSRYDSTTGSPIKLKERIGLLDRKLRVVCENAATESEWIRWTERAFKSVYGFELQGDSLFLARENLLYTFIDYMDYQLKRQPTQKELLSIANIVSWNIWQMDALTLTIPYQTLSIQNEQISFFDNELEQKHICYCKIKDWGNNEIIDFIKLTERGMV